MPSASRELQEKWEDQNGNEKATAFLLGRGFRLTQGWKWERAQKPDAEADSAIEFMFREFDYGGWVKP